MVGEDQDRQSVRADAMRRIWEVTRVPDGVLTPEGTSDAISRHMSGSQGRYLVKAGAPKARANSFFEFGIVSAFTMTVLLFVSVFFIRANSPFVADALIHEAIAFHDWFVAFVVLLIVLVTLGGVISLREGSRGAVTAVFGGWTSLTIIGYFLVVTLPRTAEQRTALDITKHELSQALADRMAEVTGFLCLSFQQVSEAESVTLKVTDCDSDRIRVRNALVGGEIMGQVSEGEGKISWRRITGLGAHRTTEWRLVSGTRVASTPEEMRTESGAANALRIEKRKGGFEKFPLPSGFDVPPIGSRVAIRLSEDGRTVEDIFRYSAELMR